MNHIVMATDGILECDKRRFDDDQSLVEILHDGNSLQIEPVLTNVLQWKVEIVPRLLGGLLILIINNVLINIKEFKAFILELLFVKQYEYDMFLTIHLLVAYTPWHFLPQNC